MAEGKRNESLMDRVWEFFTSLKLAIFVIIILAVTSIIGTIIEQNQPLEKYRQFYSDGTIRIFESVGLFDMYHSWWFLLLLVLFTVNLICCTLDRLPRVVRVVRNPKTTLDENLEKTMGLVERWKRKGELETLAATYQEAMTDAFARPRVTENAGTLHLYAEKGVISRFGVYVTHLSIIIIFIGAIIGNVFGFKGYANIVEGESASVIPTRGGTTKVDLGFAVRCNKFWVDYYPNGQPKEYSSDLSIIENGKEVLRKRIEVNDPLQYKGVWFYQASYGSAGATTVKVAVNAPDGSSQGNRNPVPGTKGENRRLRDHKRHRLPGELPGARSRVARGPREAGQAACPVLAPRVLPRVRPSATGLALPVVRGAQRDLLHGSPGGPGPRGEHRVGGLHPDGGRHHDRVLPVPQEALDPSLARRRWSRRRRPRRIDEQEQACLREKI